MDFSLDLRSSLSPLKLSLSSVTKREQMLLPEAGLQSEQKKAIREVSQTKDMRGHKFPTGTRKALSEHTEQ